VSIPEYPVLMSLFLIILQNSGYVEVQPNEYADNELDYNEYMIVHQPPWAHGSLGEYEIRFRGVGRIVFHLDSGLLVSTT
jgi:hypothetical protein